MSVPPLSHFLPATRLWFAQTFDQATPVQQAAWDAIARGSHTLVVAPTGSGKTLAAFLHAIDALFRERSREATVAPGETTRVLYISPVKALAAGVSPLRRHPPDILITTPESLYLLLTSQGRDTLRGVTSVIVDEIHALAGNKRGAHLALSLERLDTLLARPAQRIGLSATVNPPETVARFLAGRRQVTIVNPPMPRPLQLRVTVPVPDLMAPPPLPGSESEASALWPHLEAGILAAVLRHHTTLVFTNSRALAAARRLRRDCSGAPRLRCPGAAPADRERAEKRCAPLRGGHLQPGAGDQYGQRRTGDSGRCAAVGRPLSDANRPPPGCSGSLRRYSGACGWHRCRRRVRRPGPPSRRPGCRR